jgi:predicted CXXCH cytochrome family protein
MGRSAEFVSKSAPVEKYDPSGRATFSSGAFDLEVEKSPEGMRHRVRLREPAPVPVPEFVTPVEIAIGSGTRGRSYLAVDGGAVWQTPVSWFGPDQRWDVSPGFRLGHTMRRPILPACLYCHVDHVEPIPGADNRYREPVFAGRVAIGCERCHGPGELHVAERATGTPSPALDTSIVNPRHLSPALQFAVCEQCHLQGEERVNRRGRDLFEFRPGLPFEQFVSVHVRHPDIAEANKSVGQFEQMEQSRCFTASGGRLLCTSCHDPHAAPEPAARDAHYRTRCLSCHTPPKSKDCSLPLPERQAKNDSCIACHMPKAASSNIIHASVTDHRVPRTPEPPPAARGVAFGTPPLVRFRAGPLSPPPEERQRDLAIALARFGRRAMPKELAGRDDVRVLAVERLKTSLARWPGDADAWGALALTRSGRDEAAEKLKAAANAAALAPGSEAALADLTEAATAAGELDLAEETAGRRVRMSPNASDPLVARAFVYLTRGDWAKAEADSLAALRVQPLHPEARLYLAICLHKKGDRAGGLREAQTAALLESDPGERAYLMGWYQRAIR